ncbi:GntR family transcriptional regulator [Chenggangzhangella methanolivorans]|uniref:GntR family transcriptional regulator n=1 Tax=Chenggangzhangella methanolivorans TaxID=1437009 RepID=A0A9E6RD72_9HYPH|nr:GntR family transcriptional regulator [Chenggangzhangella methanolivorans]QZN98895.1 GntR family transcriptional regulator [Chenggangzhangella methanolivorans]
MAIIADIGDQRTDSRPRGEAMAELRRRVEDAAQQDEPRHLRLRAAILGMIADGLWTPGDKLPAETELARASGLSLGTAQKALGALARDGALIRRHGHGTFVPSGASQAERLLHFRFVSDDDSAIAPVYAEAIERRVTTRRGPWSAMLVEASRFIRIRRRITVAEEFDCLSEFYIDGDRFAGVLDMPMSELHRVMIRTVLEERFDVPTLFVDQRVQATQFTPEIAKLLKLESESYHGLALEVRSYTRGSQPIAFQHIFIPPNVRKLQLMSGDDAGRFSRAR